MDLSAQHSCLFCGSLPAPIIAENDLAVAFRDGFPVSPGHTLVIPRRHVSDWFDATPAEQQAMLSLVQICRASLLAERSPDGFNIGINCGSAAGQTVMHLHMHLIPRFTGDVDDPTGGVRFVIPEKGDYKIPGRIPQARCAAQRLAKGGPHDHFWTHIRPLFAQASLIRIVAAFVQNSGVQLLDAAIQSALGRGGNVQIITGDYLNLTQEQALRHLLTLQTAEALSDDTSAEGHRRGTFEIRVIEMAKIQAQTFHPKAWLFSSPMHNVAFVGSSNISRAALTDGVEWNLRICREHDSAAFNEIDSGFRQLWTDASQIDNAWLAEYSRRARDAQQPLPPGEASEFTGPPPEPRPIQQQALAALQETRDEGEDRGLVVFATGLGKTWLAAFDFQQIRREQPNARLLFIAHRIEILRQAARTFQHLFPDDETGFLVGGLSPGNASLVFASVQSLSKDRLSQLKPAEFDYIVIDEVHHAAAESYREILNTLQPRFWLGLTATPERADGEDIMSQLDDNIVFEAGLGPGIDEGHLVPFRYFGLTDSVDYSAARIPWRKGRFDQRALDAALRNEERMAAAWDAWQTYPGQRTLVFCCSIQHAEFARDYLADHGVRNQSTRRSPPSRSNWRQRTCLRNSSARRRGNGMSACSGNSSILTAGPRLPLKWPE